MEHIAKQVTGAGLAGANLDNELSHLLFNMAIALFSLTLLFVYPRNPWVYPLCVLSVLHGIEHIYIFEQYLRTGVTNGPGLFGQEGAFGVFPVARLDLHNAYNGFEVVLMTLGFWHETEAGVALSDERSRACE